MVVLHLERLISSSWNNGVPRDPETARIGTTWDHGRKVGSKPCLLATGPGKDLFYLRNEF